MDPKLLLQTTWALAAENERIKQRVRKANLPKVKNRGICMFDILEVTFLKYNHCVKKN